MKKLIPLFLLILCTFSSFAQLPTSGLVAWYPFCGNSNDYSGNGYNMVNSGATPTTDRFGNPNCAYAFNGINNIMRLGYLLPVTTNFTYSCWALPDTDQNAIIVYNGFSGSNGYGIILSNPPVYSVGHNLTVLFGGINHMATYTVTTHQWHHAVLRKTGSSFDFIIDTVIVATFTASFVTPGGTFAFGADTAAGHAFQGNIDDIAVYNRALSNAEISQLYHFNPSIISFTSGNDTTVCAGATVTLNGVASGGAWSSNNPPVATVSGSGVVTSISSGTSIIAYSTGVGCLGTETVNVTAPPSVISGPANVCIGSAITLSDAVTGGTWSSGSSGIATITPGPGSAGIVSGVSAGTAIITYATGTGCLVTASITVFTAPSAITGSTGVCVGSATTLSDSPIGGTWSSSNTAAATVTPGPAGGGIVTGVAAGTSMITYSLSGSCFTTATITVNPPPSAISGLTNVCAGSAITLSDPATGGAWSSGSLGIATVTTGPGSAGIVSGVAAGTAVISYTSGAGCFITISVIVTSPPVAITGTTNICAGSTTTLSDSPTGGTWSSSNTAAATITSGPAGGGLVSGVAVGISVITYTSGGGCSRTATVTVNPMPSVITGITHICTGLTTILSDALAGGLWSTSSAGTATVGSTTGIVTGTTAGTAIIFYSLGGCLVTASVTVNIEPSVISGSPNICTDGTTTLTATPGAGIWNLSNTAVATIAPVNADTAIISGITTGTTLVTYSLSGCTTITTITAVSFLPPITGPSLVCTGRSITLSNSVIGGTWTSTNTSIATVVAATGFVTGVSAGSPDISYSIGGHCIASATVMVNPSPYPGIINGLPNLCVGTSISLSDTVSGGLWGTSNDSAAISGGLVTGVSPGTDTVTYIVSTAFCSDTAFRSITVYAVPVAGIITGDTVICVGATITLSEPAIGVWSTVLPGIATITAIGPGSAGITGLSVGIDTIKYVVSNPGCADTASHIVTVYALPAIGAISGRAVVCEGAVFTLSDAASGGLWSSNNIAVATVNGNTGLVYTFGTGATTITYTIGPNAGDCYSIATFTVTAHPVFTTDSAISQIKCYGDNNGSIAITITGGAPSFSWSNGGTASSISGLTPGLYTLSLTDAATQCSAADSFYISGPDSLSAIADVTKDLCKRGIGSISTTVTGGTPGYQYLWSGNTTGTSLQNLRAGTYTLTITDNNNCTKTISVAVDEDTCSAIIVHNAITPNGDGVNDTWVIEGIENYPTNTVQVFDKWGDMVYEKSGYNNDWTGKEKSGLLPDGTYYYLIKLNAQNGAGTQNIWTGSLLIKR